MTKESPKLLAVEASTLTPAPEMTFVAPLERTLRVEPSVTHHAHAPHSHDHVHGHAHTHEHKPASADVATPEIRLHWFKRLDKVAEGLLKLIPALAVGALDRFFGHALDPISAVLFGIDLDTVAALGLTWGLGPMDDAWRGYKTKKRRIDEAKAPYDGTGYPEAAATYAVENVWYGYHDEGLAKKVVSSVVIAGALPYQIVGHAIWNIKAEWKKIWAQRQLPAYLGDFIFKVAASVGVIIPYGVYGALKGVARWYNEVFVDGSKRNQRELLKKKI